MNDHSILITAHSGCEDTAIDTMDSIEKALQLGADAIEIDVRVDPFGSLRISHNPLTPEEYLKKNLLEDVFRRVQPTSLLINFDLKELEALYKTLNAAREFEFSTDRLIFTGCIGPEVLANDKDLSNQAQFFLNLEEILKYIYAHRKSEFVLEDFLSLMDDPWILLFDDNVDTPIEVINEFMRTRNRLRAITQELRNKIYEDVIRTCQELNVAAVNLPKFVLGLRIVRVMLDAGIPISVWTVNEPYLVKRCSEMKVKNITTRKVAQTRSLLHGEQVLK